MSEDVRPSAMTRAPRSLRSSAARAVATTEMDPRLLAMIAALVVIWLVLNVLTDGIFLSPRNLFNLAVQSSVVGVMATGMVLVIVARHIDLSVGSVLGFVGLAIAFLQVEILPIDAAWNWPLTILFGLVLGALVGTWQGFWIAYRGVPAFVVTLGGLLIFRGAAFLVSDGRTIAPLNPTYQLLGGGIDGSIGAFWSWVLGAAAAVAVVAMGVRARTKRQKFGFQTKPLWLAAIMIAISVALILAFVLVMNSYNKPRTDIARGIPVPVLILIAAVVGMTILSRMTKFGRYVFAMGGNPEAANLSGINVRRVTLYIFIIMGVLCAVAAVITTARLNAGTNSMGTLSELSVIAAAVIGGTSLAGGRGTIPGAILGAVIIQSLDNGMVLMSVSSATRMVVIGLVLIAAVWFDVSFNKARE